MATPNDSLPVGVSIDRSPTDAPSGTGRYGTILDGISKTINTLGDIAVDVFETVDSVRRVGDNRDGATTPEVKRKSEVVITPVMALSVVVLVALAVYLFTRKG